MDAAQRCGVNSHRLYHYSSLVATYLSLAPVAFDLSSYTLATGARLSVRLICSQFSDIIQASNQLTVCRPVCLFSQACHPRWWCMMDGRIVSQSLRLRQPLISSVCLSVVRVHKLYSLRWSSPYTVDNPAPRPRPQAGRTDTTESLFDIQFPGFRSIRTQISSR